MSKHLIIKPKKILIIRRDNIGDLVCTTPLFTTLRENFPKSHIAALVNSYNAPVLNGNPDIDAVHIYQKAKHRASGKSVFSVWLKTLWLTIKLRRQHWDYVIVATTAYSKSSLKFAYAVNPKHIVAVAPDHIKITDPIHPSIVKQGHQTEAVFKLLTPLKIDAEPGAVKVFLPKNISTSKSISTDNSTTVGLHISARKINQRWSVENFSALAHHLDKVENINFLVFWSPGSASHPQHPGDDEKANILKNMCKDISLTLYPTEKIEELIEGLSRCDQLICSDGGGMHIAAGLGKPIVCLFGNSSAAHWHPWGVPYELLQKKSELVADISVDEVATAYLKLIKKITTVIPNTV